MQHVVPWKQKLWLQLAVIYTRYLLGGAFVFASLIKIKGHRFALMPAIDAPVHSPERLFEALYQSGLYWQCLGFAQLVAGLLLLTQRYTLLGALLFLPIIANVYVITISYDFGYTSVITGAMLLATVGLLAWHRLRVVVNQPALAIAAASQPAKLWEIIGTLLFLFTAGYRTLTDRYNFLLWVGTCTGIGVAGLAIYWKRRCTRGV
jgi:hypothetical protein